MSEENYPIHLKLRIDWSDLDYFGHVNNVSFFKYIQAARVNYWDEIGLTQSHLETNIGPLLASCQCDFKQKLKYPGEVIIHSRVHFIKNTSFGIQHQLYNHHKELVATATDVLVMFNYNANQKTQVPGDLIDVIEKLEGRVIKSMES